MGPEIGIAYLNSQPESLVINLDLGSPLASVVLLVSNSSYTFSISCFGCEIICEIEANEFPRRMCQVSNYVKQHLCK